MRAFCNREGLLTAFTMVSGVIPARSPKPILQNIKLIADAEEGSVLMGTDLEVGIRHRVLGVKVEQPGAGATFGETCDFSGLFGRIQGRVRLDGWAAIDGQVVEATCVPCVPYMAHPTHSIRTFAS